MKHVTIRYQDKRSIEGVKIAVREALGYNFLFSSNLQKLTKAEMICNQVEEQYNPSLKEQVYKINI